MASFVRSGTREHRIEAIHIVARPRKAVPQPHAYGQLACSPPEEAHAGSPVDSCLGSSSRTSFESTLSELSLACSMDLHFPSPLSSLVRAQIPEDHSAYLRKVMKKLRPGQQLPARKVRHLGRGGVGEVHLLELELPSGDRLHVAHKAIVCRKYDAARHAREVAAMELAAAACPFVLRLYGATHPGKPPFGLYTEFAPLGSLHDLIVARRLRAGRHRGAAAPPLFTDGEVRWLAARVLAALRHIHRLGLVHRDVSPHNIYRSATGHPLLADFDAAEMVDEEGLVYPARRGGGGAGAGGAVVGRLATAAPEVRAAAYGGGPYGTKADMWGLGAVLLEMVSEQAVADGPELADCSAALRGLLLEGLLVPQGRRLDAEAAAQHPFFEGVDWANLEFEEAPPGLRGEHA